MSIQPRSNGHAAVPLASLVLLAGLLAAPSSAHASCGNHVAVRGESLTVPAKPPPCQGPSCGQRPAPAPVTPVAPPSSTTEQGAWLPAGLAIPDLPDRACQVPSAHFWPASPCFRIERPPRPFASLPSA